MRGVHVILALALSVGLSCDGRADERTHRADPTGQESLILEGLPGGDTAAYRYLREIAGPMAGERLEMSGAELWQVDEKRLDMLHHVAGEQGVAITRMGDAFSPVMTVVAKLAPESSGMLERMRLDKAVTGLSMVELKSPAELEYALARGTRPMMGMDGHPLPMAASAEVTGITIGLPGGEQITVQRSFVETTALGCFWQGRVTGTDMPVSLMWWPGGRMAGTIMHGGRVYQIRNFGDAAHALVEIDPRRLPPEHPPLNRRADLRPATSVDAVARTGEAMRARVGRLEAGGSAADAAGDANRIPDEIAALLPGSANRAGAPVADQPDFQAAAGTPAAVAISVLVAYTDAASRQYTDIERDLIALAIEQTNQSFRDSGVAHVTVELAGAVRVAYDEGDGNHFNHLWRMVDRGDGHLEGIFALREDKKADVVVLVVDSATGCGLATRVAAPADEAFAVVHHGCATTSYSFAHEIGHIVGARHDRSLDASERPFRYGHGYVNGRKWRTMMAYETSCEKCPRLPVWSSPRVIIGGDPAGDANTDNARVIGEGAARVAAFR
ncbi:MAG: M12 family metallo-peptidase [Hyphomicrobiaceae bacterium]|nr:M12 family metallo-peptidase [Hyphomicrobiaceae bacterium]